MESSWDMRTCNFRFRRSDRPMSRVMKLWKLVNSDSGEFSLAAWRARVVKLVSTSSSSLQQFDDFRCSISATRYEPATTSADFMMSWLWPQRCLWDFNYLYWSLSNGQSWQRRRFISFSIKICGRQQRRALAQQHFRSRVESVPEILHSIDRIKTEIKWCGLC